MDELVETVNENTGDIELAGCLFYPAGVGCPLEWCRENRSDELCVNRSTGRICQWRQR